MSTEQVSTTPSAALNPGAPTNGPAPTSSKNDAVIPAKDVITLVQYVCNLANKHGHIGHSMLNKRDLGLHGQELLSKLLKEIKNKRLHGKSTCVDIPFLKACLKKRFVQDVCDLRKAWCLSKSRGATTVQFSHLEAVTEGGWAPSETMYGSATYSPEDNQDVVDAFIRTQSRMGDMEWSICYALYILGCDTSEIEVMYDIPKDAVRHTIDRINAVLHASARS